MDRYSTWSMGFSSFFFICWGSGGKISTLDPRKVWITACAYWWINEYCAILASYQNLTNSWAPTYGKKTWEPHGSSTVEVQGIILRHNSRLNSHSFVLIYIFLPKNIFFHWKMAFKGTQIPLVGNFIVTNL